MKLYAVTNVTMRACVKEEKGKCIEFNEYPATAVLGNMFPIDKKTLKEVVLRFEKSWIFV